MMMAAHNPWLEIPLEDYEAHMRHPAVAQAPLLAAELERAVQVHRPRSVALLGCAGGNGLERLAPYGLARILALDVHPAYVAATRARFERGLPRLEVLCADAESPTLEFAPVDLLFTALLLEHVALAPAFATLARNCEPGAHLVTVIELEQPGRPAVTATPYASLGLLAGHMRLRTPAEVRAAARAVEFELQDEAPLSLATGKVFWRMTFRARAAPGAGGL